MNNIPLFSIAIPTFNRLEYFKLALNSALAQTYQNVEIVILDNASSDGTQAYLNDVITQHSNITVIRNDENIGFARNIMQIPQYIKGKYLTVLSDDDLLMPTFVELAVSSMETSENIALWYCRTQLIDASGANLRLTPDYSTKVEEGADFIRDIIVCKKINPYWCSVVYRVKNLITIGGFVNVGNALDFAANCCVASQGMVVFNKKTLSFYRSYDTNLTRKTHFFEWFESEYAAFQHIQKHYFFPIKMADKFFSRVLVSRLNKIKCLELFDMLSYGVHRYGVGVYFWFFIYLPRFFVKIFLLKIGFWNAR